MPPHRFRYGERAALLHGLAKQPGSGIVYCATRKKVEHLAAYLQTELSAPYHSRLSRRHGNGVAQTRPSRISWRSRMPSSWQPTPSAWASTSPTSASSSTTTFPPAWRPITRKRAARDAMDGRRSASCTVSLVDRHTQEFFIDKIGENNATLTAPQIELLQAHARQKLERMFQYAYARRCRRRSILDYFGDNSEVTHCACDVCRGDVRSQPSPASPRTRKSENVRQAASAQRGGGASRSRCHSSVRAPENRAPGTGAGAQAWSRSGWRTTRCCARLPVRSAESGRPGAHPWHRRVQAGEVRGGVLGGGKAIGRRLAPVLGSMVDTGNLDSFGSHAVHNNNPRQKGGIAPALCLALLKSPLTRSPTRRPC